VRVDTGNRAIDDVVNEILGLLRERLSWHA
jgi:hypothetical protein